MYLTISLPAVNVFTSQSFLIIIAGWYIEAIDLCRRLSDTDNFISTQLLFFS